MGYIFACAGLVTSCFYILIILFSKDRPISKQWLIAFIILLDLTLLPYILNNLQVFTGSWMNSSFVLLWGPVLYYYIVSLLKEKINYRWFILHLLPFASYYSLSTFFGVQVLPGPPEAAGPHFHVNHSSTIIFNFIQACSFVGYAAFTLWVLNRHQKNIQDYYSYKDVYLTIRWSYLIIIFFAFGYIFVVVAEWFISSPLRLVSQDIQLVMITIFLYILGYLGIHQQPVYLNLLDDIVPLAESTPELEQETENSSNEKYVKNKLSNTLKEEYKTKLLDFLEKEKPYLQPKLSINELSTFLHIPKHFISQVINDSLGHTFYSLINSYRVQEVKRRISEDKQDKFTLLAIALDSGFNSKSGFINNFKHETGLTPMEYRKRQRAE
jgi:AraC-like DNA-binding protein